MKLFSNMNIFKKNYIKFSIGLVSCLFVRLVPFRPPNIEPILATQMPFSKLYGPQFSFLFAFSSIILFDLITKTQGMWSLFTATTYGLLGFFAYYYFLKKTEPTRMNYVAFAIFGTLFFDIVTGLSVGPLFFNQTLLSALYGQIPFTLWHLLGNISFAFILSPAIYKLLIKKREPKPLSNIILNPKTI